MEIANDEKVMEGLYDHFIKSFAENRDPRSDLNIDALKKLKGPYLEKAKSAILTRLEKSLSHDAVLCSRAIDLVDAVPLMKKWLEEIKTDPTSKYRHPSNLGMLAFTLYTFTNDEGYIPDIIQTVREEGYSDFAYGVSWLGQVPLTEDGVRAVWEKYNKGRTIKEPNGWREKCAFFLRKVNKEPVWESFFHKLPIEDQKELLDLIGESEHQRLERKFRLEKYIYRGERYNKDDINRYGEYIKIGGTPIKGMALKSMWDGGIKDIYGIEWSPDGQSLAVNSGWLQNDLAQIWNLESGEFKVLSPIKEHRYSHYELKRMAWITDTENNLAVIYDTKDKYQVAVWDFGRNKLSPPVFETSNNIYINNLIACSGKKLVLQHTPNTLLLIDPASKNEKRILEEYSGRFEVISPSRNGRLIAIGYYELKDPKTGIEYQQGSYGEGVIHEVLIYDLEAQAVVHRFNTGHVQTINKISWMPGKPIIAVASNDNSISIWDLRAQQKIALLESDGVPGRVTNIDFSSNGTLLTSTTDRDNILRVWRTDKWEEVAALREMGGYGTSLSFHPSLPILASTCSLRAADDNSSDKSPIAIRIWEFDYESFLTNPPFMEEFKKKEEDIRIKLLRKEITEDLEYIKIGGEPTKGIKLRHILEGHTNPIQHISWSPDGTLLASPSSDKTVRIWDERTGRCISTFQEQEEIKHSAWSPNGQTLIFGGNKQIKAWNVNDREPVELLQGDFPNLESLEFSPDGKMLAMSYGRDTIQVLDTSTWKEINKKVFPQRSRSRIIIQWFDDGSQIVSNPQLGILQTLDIQTLEPTKTIAIPGERDETYGFSFIYAKFGNILAVAEEKNPIMLFDITSGQLEREFDDSETFISGLVFSPDGRILVSWCNNNFVYLWQTSTGKKITELHEYALRMIEPVYPAFHPKKQTLITFCDKRRSMRVWDFDYKELLDL